MSISHTPHDLLAGNKYIFHNDSGHGWLEVHRGDLVELDIEFMISPCSCQKDEKVFLEEDCDLPRFFRAYEEHFGISLSMGNIVLANVVYDGDDSPIRGYASYRP